jgi:hypothetical protein
MAIVVTMAGSFGDARNPPAVAAMRAVGHTVRNFLENNKPLDLAIDRRVWSVARFTAVHCAPEVRVRFEVDRTAIETADAVVLLVSPAHSGRASHWEAGFACGIGVPVIAYVAAGTQPETAYLWARAFVSDIPSLLAALSDVEAGAHVVRSAKRA